MYFHFHEKILGDNRHDHHANDMAACLAFHVIVYAPQAHILSTGELDYINRGNIMRCDDD
jgi:hypothetical protein